MTTPLLEVDRLSVRFGAQGKPVVDDISFSIAPREKFALVGESGSGKTVTAQSILRLLLGARYGGAIRFEGRDVLSLSESELVGLRGRDIAMIFQEPMTALNPLYSIGRQIGEVLDIHEGLSRPLQRQRAIELLHRTGIPEPERRVDSFPHQLSGGQRQRAMIAMALACRPRLLIADEPTTALDVTIQKQILALLDELQEAEGMSILFITHDLGLVRRYADRVAVMERGRIVETGTTAELFARPQHPYTRRLMESRPERRVQALAPDSPVVAEASAVTVGYRIKEGWFGHRWFDAVRRVSFSLRRGESLGIVGESGSGKTTLGMALLALEPVRSGTLQVGGTELVAASRAALGALRRRIQVVFQDPFASLSPRMTIGRIVGEGLLQHFPDMTPVERDRRVRAALDEVGLDSAHAGLDLLNRYPHEFSGGQRQRIAIARALVMQPQILVLDEPTSALDVSVQKQVLELLAELQRRHGMSFVFISHDLAVVRAMSHRIAVMKDGEIVEEGEAESLFAAPQHPYTQALLSAAL